MTVEHASVARQLTDLPGPPRWPIVGNLPQIEVASMHQTLEAWARRYGSLYRVHLGRRNALVVAESELIGRMLRERPDGWRRLRSMQSVIREAGGHGVFSAEGDDWRRQRRHVMRAFDPGHLHRFFPSLVRVTERMKDKLDTVAASGRAIDLQAFLMRYTVDVTAGLAFGIDMNTLEEPDDPLQAHLDQMFPMLMKRIVSPLPWWRYVRLPSDRRYDKHLAAVHEAVAGFVAGANARIARDPSLRERPTNLLEAMIAARDDGGGGLTDAEIVGNVFTVLLAGEDTTANTLSWTLHLLHTHRDAWDALRREADEILGVAATPRTFEQARGFDFVEDCVGESMRLFPIAPFMLLQNNVDTIVGDVALPADTSVLCLMRHDSVDPARVPEATSFAPSRWRDDAQRATLKASMPFGAGPRLCPGRYLAMLEMKMVLATIARNFDLVSVETADGAPPREHLAFTMYPEGLQLRLAPRAGR